MCLLIFIASLYLTRILILNVWYNFRYIKEEAEDGEEEPEAEPVTVTEDLASSETSLNLTGPDAGPPAYQPEVAAESQPMAEAISSPAPAIRSPSPLLVESTARPSASGEPAGVTQNFGSSQVNGFHPDPVDVKPPEAAPEPAKIAAKPQEPIAPSESAVPAMASPLPSPPSAVAPASSTHPQASTDVVKKPEAAATLTAPAQSSPPSQTPSTNGRSTNGPSK